MQDGVRNVFTYKRSCIRIIMYSYVLSNVQRLWFGTDVPISYTVIPGKIFSVHVLTSSPWEYVNP